MALYLVATPIGNLQDISQRALDVLRAVSLLAVEDTRSAQRLCAAFEIPLKNKTLLSYGDHNEKQVTPRLAEELKNGNDVAVISEAGTPLISDPGYRLIQAAIENDIAVIPIPGPCAAITALIASGLPVHSFTFKGFIPKKQGARKRMLDELKDREETLIFYESPKRLEKVLPDLIEAFGEQRNFCIAREMTKLHETFIRMTLGSFDQLLKSKNHGISFKGECVVLIEGRTKN